MEAPKFTLEASELIMLARKMGNLTASADFKAYEEILKGQVQNWRERIEVPSPGVDAAFVNEFNKGTLFGIRLILDLPHRIMREAQDLISRQEKMNERPNFAKPGQPIAGTFGVGAHTGVFRQSPDSIADELGELVGPNARVTADSNT